MSGGPSEFSLRWRRVGDVPAPERGEVHVWRALHQIGSGPVADAASVISMGEKEHSRRIRRPVARAEYIAGWAFLRRILGRYLGVSPKEVRFTFGPRGKPSLCESRGDLQFSLSHSGGDLLAAVTRGMGIGVDLETIRPDRPHLALARRFFSSREAETIAALPARAGAFAFASLWTRKEAYLKATGEGISFPALREIEVSLTPGLTPEILQIPAGLLCPSPWTLLPVYPGRGRVGAVCVAGFVSSLHLLEETQGERTA